MNILNQNKCNQNKTQESEILGYMKQTSTGILLLPNRDKQKEKQSKKNQMFSFYMDDV